MPLWLSNSNNVLSTALASWKLEVLYLPVCLWQWHLCVLCSCLLLNVVVNYWTQLLVAEGDLQFVSDDFNICLCFRDWLCWNMVVLECGLLSAFIFFRIPSLFYKIPLETVWHSVAKADPNLICWYSLFASACYMVDYRCTSMPLCGLIFIIYIGHICSFIWKSLTCFLTRHWYTSILPLM